MKGSGKFVSETASLSQVKQEPSGDITLNFVNAEIGEVSRAVLGGILKANFAIDPSVKGNITLQTTRPIPRRSVMPALESAFALVGVAVVSSGGINRVVPIAKASKQAVPLSISGTRAANIGGFAIRVVPLRFVSADEMKKILTPFASQDTVVSADQPRNLMVLAAPSPELRSLEDVISTFDVDWLKGLSLAMIPLEFVDPETLVKELDEIFGKEKSPLSGVLRFVPLKRMNSVLVVSTQPAYIERAQGMVEKLDRGASGSERQLFVYNVQNTNANDVAETLHDVISLATQVERALSDKDLSARIAMQLHADILNRWGKSMIPQSLADAFPDKTCHF